MNTIIQTRALVLGAALAGFLVTGAFAHHGNPQAPAPRWEEATRPGLPTPQVPQGPGY